MDYHIYNHRHYCRSIRLWWYCRSLGRNSQNSILHIYCPVHSIPYYGQTLKNYSNNLLTVKIKNMKKVAFILITVLSLTVFNSCREKTTEEKVEDAIENTGDAIEDAAEDTGDAIEDAADEVEDAVE